MNHIKKKIKIAFDLEGILFNQDKHFYMVFAWLKLSDIFNFLSGIKFLKSVP